MAGQQMNAKTIPMFGILLVLVLIAVGTAVYVELPSLNHLKSQNISFPTGGGNITLYFNVPRYVWFNYTNLTLSAYDNSCFQEYFNVSTSCGGNETGVETHEAGIQNASSLFDGDYLSGAYVLSNRYDAWINYTKPDWAVAAVWHVYADNRTGKYMYNFTLPDYCFNAFPDYIRVSFGLETNRYRFWCWNYTDSSQLYLFVLSDSFGINRSIYEEAVSWYSNKSYINHSANLINLSIDVGNTTPIYEYNITGNFTYNELINISINSSIVNNILRDQCNCSGCSMIKDNCSIPIIFHADNDGILSIKRVISLFQFDVDFNSDAINSKYKNSTSKAYSYYTIAGVNTTSPYYDHTVRFWIPDVTPIGNASFGESTNRYGHQLHIFPDWGVFHADMLITYGNLSYPQTYNVKNTTMDNVSELTKLYLASGSLSQVVLTVVDVNDNPLQGVIIKVLEYDVATGAYYTLEVLETDGDGQTIATLVLIDRFYKFIIEYDGVVRLIEPETGGVRILSTSKTFRIDTEGADYFSYYDTTAGVATSLTFNNDTQSFYYTWNDPNSDMHMACLRVIKRNMTGTYELSDSCVESTAGTIVAPISAQQDGSSFIATGYLKFDFPFVTDELVYTIKQLFAFSKLPAAKLEGGFVSFLLIMTLALVGLPFPGISLILMVIGVVGAAILGFYQIGVGLVAGIIIVAIIQLMMRRE